MKIIILGAEEYKEDIMSYLSNFTDVSEVTIVEEYPAQYQFLPLSELGREILPVHNVIYIMPKENSKDEILFFDFAALVNNDIFSKGNIAVIDIDDPIALENIMARYIHSQIKNKDSHIGKHHLALLKEIIHG